MILNKYDLYNVWGQFSSGNISPKSALNLVFQNGTTIKFFKIINGFEN